MAQRSNGARSRAPVALLWDMHADDLSKAFGGQMTAPANGWAEAMLSMSGRPELFLLRMRVPPFSNQFCPRSAPRCAQKNALRHDFLTDSG